MCEDIDDKSFPISFEHLSIALLGQMDILQLFSDFNKANSCFVQLNNILSNIITVFLGLSHRDKGL